MSDLLPWESMAKVANNLIDKGDKMIDRLSNFFVWCVNHDTPNRIALDTYISDIQNSDMDPLTKAALISNARKTIREYKNQCNIVAIAMENLKSDAQPDKVDEDWLAQFMDKARLVNNDELKFIWGRILSGEFNAPKSVPKVLLHILEQMDTNAAHDFMAVSNTTIKVFDDGKWEYEPLIFLKRPSLEYYKERGISFDSLIELEALGLIHYNPTTYFQASHESKTIYYNDVAYDTQETRRSNLLLGNVLFTNAGRALFSVVEAERDSEYLNDLIKAHWAEFNATKINL